MARLAESPSAPKRAVLEVLVNALAFDEPRLLAAQVRWTESVARARSDFRHGAADLFTDLRTRVLDFGEPEKRAALGFIAAAELLLRTPHRTRTARRRPNDSAFYYLELLLSLNEDGARGIVELARKRGQSLSLIYRNVLEPALIEAGSRWQMALISVAAEHFVAAATLRVMDGLSRAEPRPESRARTFVAMCAPGEGHDIGLRMITDRLSLAGWETIYLGANVPIAGFADVLKRCAPAVIGLSVTMSAHLLQARDAIAEIRQLDPRLPVVVGGGPLRDGGDLWSKLGADAGPAAGADAIGCVEHLGDALEAKLSDRLAVGSFG